MLSFARSKQTADIAGLRTRGIWSILPSFASTWRRIHSILRTFGPQRRYILLTYCICVVNLSSCDITHSGCKHGRTSNLGPVYTKRQQTLQQLCNDASDSVLIGKQWNHSRIRIRLHHALVSMLSQLSDDAGYNILIENNGVTWKWVQ